MIFVTIGTQETFDRLIKAIDNLAPFFSDHHILAQKAESNYSPQNIECISYVTPKRFDELLKEADLIVSHAGMGSVISALVQQKTILIMPRLAELKEHRNNHQLATAKRLEELNYVYVAYNEHELKQKMLEIIGGRLKALHKIDQYASSELINSLQTFIKDSLKSVSK